MSENKEVNDFVKAVLDSPDIAKCLKDGLQALKGEHRQKIQVKSTRELKGSVNIDECIEPKYPNDPRWDYVLGYKSNIYYVEIHPSSTSEVGKVIKKLDELKKWRKHSAPLLEAVKDKSTYHWISSGGTTKFTKNSNYRRRLTANKILPSSRLDIK